MANEESKKVSAKVNPKLDTRGVTVPTGETDKDGNALYVDVPNDGRGHLVDEKLVGVKNAEGTQLLVKA